MSTTPFRSGFVAFVGRPNVGKSTLMNKIVGQKIAIVSSKAQTTRHRIKGILNRDEAQVVFVDTPGVHKPLHLLGEQLVKAATDTLSDVDLIVFLVDGRTSAGRGDKYVADLIQQVNKPVMLVLNKLDSLKVDPEVLKSYEELGNFEGVRVISALYGKGVPQLVDELVSKMPEGMPFYTEDEVTDQTERGIAGELVREAVLRLTSEEVPHAVAVRVDEFKEREDGNAYIQATIFVERESQKGILIGEKGTKLKEIGRTARIAIEKSLDRKVYLELWVKVLPNWRKQAKSLKQLGYAVD
ncbi:GTPase Era [bacterium]|nr:GTPase Era [bacterium]